MLSADYIDRPEPRWPAVLAILAAATLHYALPVSMRVGPPWLLTGVVGALVALAWLGRRTGRHHVNEWAGIAVLLALTAALVFGMYMLLGGLLVHSEKAPELLQSAGVLWVTNVLVFAVGYWRLDAGGPNQRERRDVHRHGAFLFPQMAFSTTGTATNIAEEQQWRPGFVDYLFVAFTTSTAFSPTDTPPLSHWSKLAMMVQGTLSFTIVLLLVGRVVNIL